MLQDFQVLVKHSTAKERQKIEEESIFIDVAKCAQ